MGSVSNFRGAYRYLRLLYLVYSYQKRNMTVPKAFKGRVQAHPNRVCLIHEDTQWTFQDMEDFSNRVAHYFLRMGYKPGDCMALVMNNCPEYVGLWLGCAKIGMVPALINSNLSGQPLLHSIEAASAKVCIYGSDLSSSKCSETRSVLGFAS